MSDWPADYHPIEDGVVDKSVTVQLYPHAPGESDDLIAWAGGGTTVLINGGPCVILHTTRAVPDRLVGLGDVAINDGVHSVKAFPGGEIGANYQRADLQEPPPVD